MYETVLRCPDPISVGANPIGPAVKTAPQSYKDVTV